MSHRSALWHRSAQSARGTDPTGSAQRAAASPPPAATRPLVWGLLRPEGSIGGQGSVAPPAALLVTRAVRAGAPRRSKSAACSPELNPPAPMRTPQFAYRLTRAPSGRAPRSDGSPPARHTHAARARAPATAPKQCVVRECASGRCPRPTHAHATACSLPAARPCGAPGGARRRCAPAGRARRARAALRAAAEGRGGRAARKKKDGNRFNPQTTRPRQ